MLRAVKGMGIFLLGFWLVVPVLGSGHWLTTTGLFDAEGRLVRQWEVATPEPTPLEGAWDGRDDRGRPLPAGHYEWRTVRWDAKALRSRWVMSLGAHPALDGKGHPVYFPGAIVGASRLEANAAGTSLFIGAPVGDASDILMKTDLQAQRALWSVTLYQPSLHAVHALRRGGPEDENLLILQGPDRIHVYAPDGRELEVTRIPSTQSQKAHAQIAANRAYLAVSYPDEDLVRLFHLPGMQPAGEVEVPVPKFMAFAQPEGRDLLIVSYAERKIFRAGNDGEVRIFNETVEAPGVIRRYDAGFAVASTPDQYLQREDPEGHNLNLEHMVSERGSRVVFLDPQGREKHRIGTGISNFEGPWRKANLNGILDMVVTTNQVIVLDWPNRLVYLDRESGDAAREVMLGEGSYFSAPAVDPEDPTRVYVRGMYNKYYWQFRVDPAAGTWQTERLIYNTAAGMGATQSHFPRLFSQEDRRYLLMSRLMIAAVEGNRTWPVLRTHLDGEQNGEERLYQVNLEMVRGAPDRHVRPETGLADVDLGAIMAYDRANERLILNQLFSPTLALLPVSWNEAGAPVPQWEGARMFYDARERFPELDLYQHHTGVFDQDGNYYGTFADRNVNVQREKGHHPYWPGQESAHSVLYSLDPSGRTRFEVHATQVQRLAYRGFVQGVISDVLDEWLFLTDRARPGQQIFTTDGLFAGNTWYHNRPEEVPPTLQDPYTRADIVKGAVFRGEDGNVYHAQANINRVDLYEILGLDQFERQRGSIVLTGPVTAPLQKGTGLNVLFTGIADEQAEALTRTGVRVRHDSDPYLFDHTWQSWPDGATGAAWTGWLEIPVSADYTFDVRLANPLDQVDVWLDGKPLISRREGDDHRYVKARTQRMQPGFYAVEIRYEAAGSHRAIGFNWQSPGWNRQGLPAKFLYTHKPVHVQTD